MSDTPNDDAPKNEPEWVKEIWDSAQRLGMDIAGRPLAMRETALAIVERNFKEAYQAGGASEEWIAKVLPLQMKIILETIERIDASGGSKGGSA